MGDVSFNVRSTMEAREPYSLIGPDPTDREMAFGPTLPTKLWRPGFLYATRVVPTIASASSGTGAVAISRRFAPASA